MGCQNYFETLKMDPLGGLLVCIILISPRRLHIEQVLQIEQVLTHSPSRIERGKWRKVKENEKSDSITLTSTMDSLSQLSSFSFLLWNTRELLKPIGLLQMPSAACALEEMDSCREGRQWRWRVNWLCLERSQLPSDTYFRCLSTHISFPAVIMQ